MMYLKCDSTDANFNFALEKYAIEELNAADTYFMFWRTEPTLMIGRYQNTRAEINLNYAKKKNINIVRRITGGGTIFTDMNGWQFSFINKKHDKNEIEFETFTRPIIDALVSLGIDAKKSGRNDLEIDGKKFSGNAQYISKNIKLHHGSILFDTDLETLVRAITPDDEKLISKGIHSVRGRVTNIADHLEKSMTSTAFRDVMLQHLLRDMDTYELTETDIRRINEIKASLFDTWEWNFGKDPRFNITKEARFTGGKLLVQSFVENGCISEIRFYGDFFAKNDLQQLEQTLKGCLYKSDKIKEALVSADAQSLFFNITIDEILSCII